MPSLSSFQEVKRRPDGRRQVFPCRLLVRETEAVILHYRLTAPWTAGSLRLQPGDDTIAYFWTARPYNLYHWIRPDGTTAGYYFNLARDTAILDDRVEWTDLGLDLLVLPDGRAAWVDQDEVAALPAADREAVARTRARLEQEYPQVVAWAAERSAFLRPQGGPGISGVKPITAVMLSESYLPRISGVVTSVSAFARALRAEGHRVLIVAPRYSGYHDEDPDVIRLASIPAPGTPEYALTIPVAWWLVRDPRLREVDVVHAHGPFLAGRLGLVVARHFRRPLVFTHHTLYDEYVHYVPWVAPEVTRPIARRWVRVFANRCDLVIAPSGIIRARLREQGVSSRIEVLPTGGVDPEQLTRLDGHGVRARYEVPPGPPLLVTVSRLAPEKSVDLLLRAFQQVAGAVEAYLLVVGDGPSAGGLQRLAGDLGITGRVRFAGALPHDAALAAMAAGDLFIFASQTETQGVVLVEAMAAGLPVVAVARAGAAEVVRDGEAGALVEPAPEALAAAVRRLLADPSRRVAMSRRAREIAAGYAVPTLARRLAALYQSVREQKDAAPQRA